jgi:hypothetical protein
MCYYHQPDLHNTVSDAQISRFLQYLAAAPSERKMALSQATGHDHATCDHATIMETISLARWQEATKAQQPRSLWAMSYYWMNVKPTKGVSLCDIHRGVQMVTDSPPSHVSFSLQQPAQS